MITFLALYQGPSIARAELVAVSSNQRIVSDFARKLVEEDEYEPGSEELEERFHAGAERLPESTR